MKAYSFLFFILLVLLLFSLTDCSKTDTTTIPTSSSFVNKNNSTNNTTYFKDYYIDLQRTENHTILQYIIQQRRTIYWNDGRIFNLTSYPPSYSLWITNSIDILTLRYYKNWRQHIHSLLSIVTRTNNTINDNSWLSSKYIVPNPSIFFPKLLSYNDYYIQETTMSKIKAENNNNNIQTSSLSQTMIKEHLLLLYEYMFVVESTELGDVTTITSMIVIFCIIILLRQIKYYIIIPYFIKIGTTLALQQHDIDWCTTNKIRIYKFSEYCFRLLYHTSISIYGIYYLGYSKQLYWNTSMIYAFNNYPIINIPISLSWYYILQCSYNVDAFISLLELSLTYTIQSPIYFTDNNTLDSKSKKKHISSVSSSSSSRLAIRLPIKVVFTDTVRGDFQEMLIHHIVTNCLIIGSSYFRLERIGSMVLLIHDISDVPVDLSKLANFVKWKITTIVCFISMSITWAYTRLYIFPFYIVWGSIQYAIYAVGTPPLSLSSLPGSTSSSIAFDNNNISTIAILDPLVYLCYKDFFICGMYLLILLHTLWFTMFIQIFITILFKNEIHDYSEHKHGEVSTTTTTATTTNSTSTSPLPGGTTSTSIQPTTTTNTDKMHTD